MKRADENEKENKNLIKLEGVEGLWYEQPDMLIKYKRRPDNLEEMCSTHFGKMITFCSNSNHKEKSGEKGPDTEEYDSDSDNDDSSDFF